jgi:hypothetical protein
VDRVNRADSMKIFHCTHCQHSVFFENTICVHCQHTLAYLPDLATVGSLDRVGQNLWRCPILEQEQMYRLCENYIREDVCNWAVPADEPHALCRACRFTQVVPDRSQPRNKEAWYKLEVAKRRLLYSLLGLGCPVRNRVEDPERGLGFEFLAITEGPGARPLLTGHADGVITINVAEADDAERERRRQQLHEPYRTLLGHFRHEVGHYYWDRLMKEKVGIDAFRGCFGDERKDYARALQAHYQQGPPTGWQQRFVSPYASSHPWEDWAETFAHYLHMTDTLEMAAASGLSLHPEPLDEPMPRSAVRGKGASESLDQLIESWFPLTCVLNNLNRGLGLPDGYPFVLSPAAIDKLRLVHLTIGVTSHKVGHVPEAKEVPK